MNALRETVNKFLREDHGPTATEYAVLLGIICLAAIAGISEFGELMDGIYATIAGAVDDV